MEEMAAEPTWFSTGNAEDLAVSGLMISKTSLAFLFSSPACKLLVSFSLDEKGLVKFFAGRLAPIQLVDGSNLGCLCVFLAAAAVVRMRLDLLVLTGHAVCTLVTRP